MRLEEYISQLLFKQDCVIVPNFGAFITNPINATFHKETNTFIPPKKDISFNSTLIKNDKVLVNKIVDDESISSDDAENFIEKQVHFWKEHLENGKILNLKNIGTLEFNEIGKIDFKPDNEINYFIPSYGLSSIKANYITEKQENEISNKYMSKLLVAASLIPIAIGGFLYFYTPTPVQQFVTEQWSGLILPLIDKKDTNQPQQVVKYDVYHMPETIEEPSLVEYQIAEILTKEDSVNISPKKVEITVVKETKINDNEKEVTAIVKQNLVTKESKNLKNQKIGTNVDKKNIDKNLKTAKKEDFAIKSKTVTANSTLNKNNNSAKKFEVIAASLKRKEDAERFLNDLKKEGYKDAGISYAKGHYYYVIYNAFENKEKAQKYMNEMTKKNPQTWVRTKK